MPTGYPQLAAFMEEKDSLMIFRRFGYLQARLLLEKQGRLTQLEDELDKMDRHDYKEEPNRIRTTNLQTKARRNLLAEADKNFREYGACIYRIARKAMLYAK
jgi:hypothetical protein